MQKVVYFLFFLFCFIIVNAQSPIYRENAVKYGGIEESRTYHLYSKKDNPACNLKIIFFYPQTYLNHQEMINDLQASFVRNFYGEKYAHLSPQKATNAYATDYEDQYRKAFEKSGIYKEEVRQANQNKENKSDYIFMYNFEKVMRNTVLLNTGNIISQVVNVYEYTGGAHGTSSTQGVVLDIDSGKEIRYEDTFREGMEDFLSDLLLVSLMNSLGFTHLDELLDAGFTFDAIRPTSNFVANDEGITFIYNPYELGAYVLGVVEILVPYEDLVLFMKPEGNLFRWARNHHIGLRIVYYDIFKYGTEQDIATLIINKLPADFAYEPEKMLPSNDFYIDEEGITFLYAEGVKVLLRYDEIKKYIKISWEKLTTGGYWELPVSPTNLPTD